MQFYIPYLIKPVFTDPVKNRTSAEFEVNKWMISKFIIYKLLPVVGYEPYPLDELMLMVSAVCFARPTHIFDWGTHVGKSARIFYETVKAFHIPSKLHTIDLPEGVFHVEHPHERRGIFIRNIDDIRQYWGDGVDVSLKVLKENKNKKTTPLFFLDGDHEYKSVKRELALIVRSVKSPHIMIHDTFYQSKDSGYNIGPYQAVKEFMKQHKGKFQSLFTDTGLPGMAYLYPEKNE